MKAIFAISAKEFIQVVDTMCTAQIGDWYERNTAPAIKSSVEDAHLAVFCPTWGDVTPLRAGYNIAVGTPAAGEFRMGDEVVKCDYAIYYTCGYNGHGVFHVNPEMRANGYPLPVGFYAFFKGARSRSGDLLRRLPRLEKTQPVAYETTGPQDMLPFETQSAYFIRKDDATLFGDWLGNGFMSPFDMGSNEADAHQHFYMKGHRFFSVEAYKEFYEGTTTEC